MVYRAYAMGAHSMWDVSCSSFKFLVLRKQLCGLKETAAGLPFTLTFQLSIHSRLCSKH